MPFNPRVPAFLAAFVFFVAAPGAHAAPIVISDMIDSAATYMGGDYGSYSSANFSNRVADGRHWGDELSDPGHPFDTTQMTVDRNSAAHTITITLHTRFNGDDQGAHYADLFIDTATPTKPDAYNYAIALGDQTMAAGLYSIGSASTSNDIWGGQSTYVYGGAAQFNPSSPDFDPNMALPVYTRLDTGTAVPDYSVAVTQQDVGGGFFDVTVALSSITNLSLFDAFDLFWGTGDCGNDAIWGSVAFAAVDAPRGFSLLCVGLLAIAGLRRRATPLQVRA